MEAQWKLTIGNRSGQGEDMGLTGYVTGPYVRREVPTARVRVDMFVRHVNLWSIRHL